MSALNGPQIELTCMDVEELLPLHSLGMLDAAEVEAIEAHLPLCPACTAVAGQFDAVAGALPLALEPITPDPSVRAHLMERVEAPAGPENVVSIAESRRSWRDRWVLYAAAAALLAVLGGSWYLIDDLTGERDAAMNKVAMLQEFMLPESQAMELEPMPAGEYPWGWGQSRLLKNPDGEMLLVVEGCPPTTDARSYPVWVAVGDDRMMVGEIEIAEDGTGWMPVAFPDEMSDPDLLGVSVIEGDQPLVDLFLGPMTG